MVWCSYGVRLVIRRDRLAGVRAVFSFSRPIANSVLAGVSRFQQRMRNLLSEGAQTSALNGRTRAAVYHYFCGLDNGPTFHPPFLPLILSPTLGSGIGDFSRSVTVCIRCLLPDPPLPLLPSLPAPLTAVTGLIGGGRGRSSSVRWCCAPTLLHLPLHARVKRIPQPVAEEIEAEHGQQDQQPWP
ncbi:MAG: hypothetical protein JWN15_2362 [Firmicutes bacterium]|nr:hypothetical protein [Bacillota bacterium]